MIPTLAFATPIKGGYRIEGIETPSYATANLESMTLNGNPILLAPTANKLIVELDNREDDILALWTEKFVALRDQCIAEAEAVIRDTSACEKEKTAYLFAMSNLTDTLCTDCFKGVADCDQEFHGLGFRLYKKLEEEAMNTDGWVKGAKSGPLTNLIRQQIAFLTGFTMTDSEVKQTLDSIADCGDPDCPIHGKTQDTGFKDTMTGEIKREDGFQDTGLNNGTVFKETDEGIVITNQTTAEGEPTRGHQRHNGVRDRESVQ